jgi:LPS sulfotransferase NodH
MLTEGRSGSNWLGSLANSTGVMGNLEEWIDPFSLGVEPEKLQRGPFMNLIFQKASTPNGRFAIKLFPRHIHMTQHLFGFDFIAETCRLYDTSLIVLRREDRLRQAISFAKACMTSQWRSNYEVKGEASYNFDLICRCYFYIERSYAFWRSYLGLREIKYHEFNYESLVSDPSPYISQIAELMEVELSVQPQTNLRVQRDKSTEDWLARFRSELTTKNVVAASLLHNRPSRTFKNLGRFIRDEQMTPHPMEFRKK